MPIPPAFEVRLAAYGITPAIDADRRLIWTILDPQFDAVMQDHIARVIEYAPAYSDNFSVRSETSATVTQAVGAKIKTKPESWIDHRFSEQRFGGT